MLAPPPEANFIFALGELQRLVRQYADQKAARFGVTRAQWAVLAKLERTEGLPQAKLAKAMDMQPITLTRLIDRLCEAGFVERRADASDRRTKRLYLTADARPLLEQLKTLRNEINRTALAHLSSGDARALVGQLESIKENVRAAVRGGCDARREARRDG
jgi:DNA-binding MarR family transcriptional regulator